MTAEEEAPVKDQGYSWLVMAANLISFLSFGMATYGSVSVLTYKWIEMFTISTDTASWAAAVMSATLFLTGPIISIINDKLGGWVMQLIGAVLSVVGLLSTALATDFWQIIIAYSVIMAFGMAMIQLATFDLIPYYFDQHEHKIYCAVLCTFFCGLVACPILIEYLTKMLSYKHTLIILAVVNAINIPIAFIYKGQCTCASLKAQTQKEEREDNPMSHEGYNTQNIQLEHSSIEVNAVSGNTCDSVHTVTNVKDTSTSHHDQLPERSKSILHSHLSLLRQPRFLLAMLHYLLGCIGENTFFTLTVTYTVERKVLTSSEAALGMTITGVSMVMGSLMLTIVSHWPVNRLIINAAVEVVFGLSIALLPVCTNIYSSYAVMIAFGLTDSVFAANVPSFVAQEFGSEQLFIAKLGYMLCAVGLGSLVGPVLSGHIASHTTYEAAFIFAGSSTMTGSAILMSCWLYGKIGKCRTVGETCDDGEVNPVTATLL